MLNEGAMLSDQDFPILLNYLARTFRLRANSITLRTSVSRKVGGAPAPAVFTATIHICRIPAISRRQVDQHVCDQGAAQAVVLLVKSADLLDDASQPDVVRLLVHDAPRLV